MNTIPSHRTMSTAASPSASATTKWKLLLLAAVVLGLLAAGQKSAALLERLLESVNALGAWGPLLFIAIYALATVVLIPGSLLTLFAGASFGLAWGSLWTSIAATLGATLAFLTGRYLARSWASKKIAGNEKFAAIDHAVTKDGWKIVGLTRLSPVFPFTLLNYAFALTKVSLKEYVLASWIGMIPGTILYVYIGSAGKAVVESEGKSTGQWLLFGIGLAATLVVTIMITRNAKRALQEKL